MSVSLHKAVMEKYGDRLIDTMNLFESLRTVKTEEEIEKTRIAAGIADKVYTRLKYQDRDSSVSCSIKSLCLREDVYEMWCDVRKVFKLSASHLIALAIQLYIIEIGNVNKIPDNYYQMYITNVSYYNETCLIQIVWGIPGQEILNKLE